MAEPYVSPYYKWGNEYITRILSQIRDNIQRIPDEKLDLDYYRQMAAYFDTDMDVIQSDVQEARDEYAGGRSAIYEDDVVMFLDESYVNWYWTFEAQTGREPNETERAIAPLLIQNFFANPSSTANIEFAGRGRLSVPPGLGVETYTWEALSSLRDLPGGYDVIVRALRDVKGIQELKIENQPLHFTTDLKQEAYLNAAEDLGLIDSSTRPEAAKQVVNNWDEIERVIEEQGTAYNPAVKTLSKRALLKAQGLEGSNEDQLSLGFLTTHFTDNPKTQAEQREILEARQADVQLTEEDYEAIISDPVAWFKKKFKDQRELDRIPDPTETAAVTQRDAYINQQAQFFGNKVIGWREAKTDLGTIKWTPEDVIKMSGASFNTSWNQRPDITELDREAARDKASRKASEKAEADRIAGYADLADWDKTRKVVAGALRTIYKGKVPSDDVIDHITYNYWSQAQQSEVVGEPVPEAKAWLQSEYGDFLPYAINEQAITEYRTNTDRFQDTNLFGDGYSLRERLGIPGDPSQRGYNYESGEYPATEKIDALLQEVFRDYPGIVSTAEGRALAMEMVMDQVSRGSGITPAGDLQPLSGFTYVPAPWTYDPETGEMDRIKVAASGPRFMEDIFPRLPQKAQNITAWGLQNPFASPFSIPAELTADGTQLEWYRSGENTPVKEVFRDGEWVQVIDYSQMTGYEIPSNYMPGSHVTRREITNYDPNTGSYDYVTPEETVVPGTPEYERLFPRPKKASTIPQVTGDTPLAPITTGGAVKVGIGGGVTYQEPEIPYDPILQEEDQSIFGFRG